MKKGKVFSIPLRLKSSLGDYLCGDGEIAELENALTGMIEESDPTEEPDSSLQSGDNEGESGDSESADSSSLLAVSFPPCPLIEFGLKRGVVPGWHNHPFRLPSVTVGNSSPSSASWSKIALDTLLSLERDITKAGMFMEPFFALCALRLNDGHHILPSSPVLMIPLSQPPLIAASGDVSASSMELSFTVAPCMLQYRLVIPPELLSWTDRISHIDLFVSNPLQLYDRKTLPGFFHNKGFSGFSHSLHPEGFAGEHWVTEESFPRAWSPVATDDALWQQNLTSISEFRLVSSIPLAEASSTLGFVDVKLNCGPLSTVYSSASYTPEYAHLSGVAGRFKTSFSARTTVCDLTLTLPEVGELSGLISRTDGMIEEGRGREAMEVTVVKEGKVLHASRTGGIGPGSEISESTFPRWLFYPDPDATQITVLTSAGGFIVPLRRHPSLHGAFFASYDLNCGDISEMGIRKISGYLAEEAPDQTSSDSYRMSSSVWRSGKGSDLFFPDKLCMKLDVERVIAMVRAFRSSGLIATTSPTAYLFTTDGIFLLKETDDGRLLDAGLISTHVLKDASCINVKGSVLEFISQSGETLRIEGTVVKDISARDGSGGSATSSAPVMIRADGSGNPVRLTSRPIKLSSGETMKRISWIALRGVLPEQGVSLKLEISNDLIHWTCAAASPSKEIGGLWTPGASFIRVSASLQMESHHSLEAIVIRVWE